MARRELQELRCIVTGASSGIGAALARALADAGSKVLLTARRAERLEQLANELRGRGADVGWCAGDVTDLQTRDRALAQVVSSWGGLDVLINNAGFGALGPFADADAARLRQVMEVNFFAPAEWTRAALPLLRRGRSPMIVNIGSVLGHRAVPGKSEYCAAKFAMHGWSDALRAELAAERIDLLLVSPSTTASEFFDQAVGDPAAAASNKARRAMTPEAVARRVVRAMRAGRHEIILSAGGKLLVWLDRLCPPLMNRLLARWA